MRVSRSSELIVRPTAELGTSTIASTPSTPSHLRAIAAPTSACDLDLDVLAAAIKILGRHACSFDRTHAVGVLEKARDVVQYAYSNDAVRHLGACRPAGKASQQHNESANALHHSSPSSSLRWQFSGLPVRQA
jgi:hypothetical protein